MDGFTIVDPAEPFTAWERAALDRLLELDHPWRDGLRVQLADAVVAGRCHHCPTIDITVPGGTPELARPAEPSSIDMPALHGQDADGMFVEIMLIVIDGRVTAMDVWRGDGGTLFEPPLENFRPAGILKE